MFKIDQFFRAYLLTTAGSDGRVRLFNERARELQVSGFHLIRGAHGDQIGKPNWWTPTARKWACNLNHLNAINCGITEGSLPILILEDDAYLRDNFIEAIHEVIAFFRDHSDATVCYLGGRIHGAGRKVSRLIERGLEVGGGYGYCVSQQHAPTLSSYFMDFPTYLGGQHRFAQDTKMAYHSKFHDHAVTRPVCVGHRGGFSVLLQRNRRPQDVS